MNTKDILTTDIVNSYIDLQFEHGDLGTKISDKQLIKLNLKYNTGHLKQDLLVGVGIDLLQNGIFTPFIKSRIISKLAYDNITAKNVTYVNKNLKIIL